MNYSNKEINEAYLNLVIHKQSDLAVTTEEILKSINHEAGSFLKDLYEYIIKEVLTRKIPNEKEDILRISKQYLKEEYNESR